MAVQVDWNDRARSRPDRRGNRRGVDGVSVAIHVDQHRLGADRGNGQHRGDEGVRRCDHLVARADAKGAQRQLDGGESAANRNRVPRADERGVFGFELFDGRTKNEVAPLEDAADGRFDLRRECAMLRFQVDERHVHGRNHFFNPRPRYTTGRRMLHQSTTGRIFVYPCSCGG